jgi:glycosyltransferase involved in cell wall biosynthesis
VIRTLHIITRLDVGGSTENTVISVTGMAPGEFASSLISGPTEDPPAGLRETLAAAGVPWLIAPHLCRPVNPVMDCRALWELRRLIKKLRPDIVHTHSSKAGFLGRLAARRAGVRHIVHTPHGHVFGGYFSPLETRLYVILERRAARWTGRIITLTDAEARQHLALRIGRLEQFVTIPSGIDLDAVLSAPPAHLVSGRLVIGAIGRLAPVKGHQQLIEAAPDILRRFPDARLLLVGDGELRPALEKRAETLGLADRIIFAGFRQDVPSIIAGMDLVVLPSLNEGMGRVLVMAMAQGKPIVASRVGGVPELLGEGEAGVLVPPGDSRALADAICELLENPSGARALGEAGRRRAPRYSAEAMIAALTKLYHEVVDGA